MLRKHQRHQPGPISIKKALKSVNVIDLKLLESIRAHDLEIAEKAKIETRTDGEAPSFGKEKGHYT